MKPAKITGIFFLIVFNFSLIAYGATIDFPVARDLLGSSIEDYLQEIDPLRVALQSDLIPRETILTILKDIKTGIRSLKEEVNDLLKDRGRLETERGILQAAVKILNNLEMMIDFLISQLTNPKDEGIKKTSVMSCVR